MSVLLHLNGAPGVGKSTIAERLVASRPGWLNCDIDILRTLIGGWKDNFAAAGAQIRPVAREMMAAQLATGRGVVLPQLIMQDRELAQFKSLATVCGVPYVHVFIGASDAELAMRWQRRNEGSPWAATSQRILRELGGTDAVLVAGGLARELAVVDRAVFIRSDRGRIDEAVAQVADLLP
jgi:predicted kinase